MLLQRGGNRRFSTWTNPTRTRFSRSSSGVVIEVGSVPPRLTIRGSASVSQERSPSTGECPRLLPMIRSRLELTQKSSCTLVAYSLKCCFRDPPDREKYSKLLPLLLPRRFRV